MNDRQVVADASAILALLLQEPFAGFDPERLAGATISAVNFSEVFEKLCSGGLSEAEADQAVAALGLQIVAFGEEEARATALLRPRTRQAGLSLADRACLVLGLKVGGTVVTADRAWMQLDVGVEIVLIR